MALTLDDKQDIIDRVQKRIDEWGGRDFKIYEADELKGKGYPFLIWNVKGSIPIRSKVHLSHYLQVRINYDALYDLVDSDEDVKEAEDKLFNDTVDKYLSYFFPQKINRK